MLSYCIVLFWSKRKITLPSTWEFTCLSVSPIYLVFPQGSKLHPSEVRQDYQIRSISLYLFPHPGIWSALSQFGQWEAVGPKADLHLSGPQFPDMSQMAHGSSWALNWNTVENCLRLQAELRQNLSLKQITGSFPTPPDKTYQEAHHIFFLCTIRHIADLTKYIRSYIDIVLQTSEDINLLPSHSKFSHGFGILSLMRSIPSGRQSGLQVVSGELGFTSSMDVQKQG